MRRVAVGNLAEALLRLVAVALGVAGEEERLGLVLLRVLVAEEDEVELLARGRARRERRVEGLRRGQGVVDVDLVKSLLVLGSYCWVHVCADCPVVPISSSSQSPQFSFSYSSAGGNVTNT